MYVLLLIFFFIEISNSHLTFDSSNKTAFVTTTYTRTILPKVDKDNLKKIEGLSVYKISEFIKKKLKNTQIIFKNVYVRSTK